MCSECVQSVLIVCSECVQSVFRVCSGLVVKIGCQVIVVIASSSASSVSVFGISNSRLNSVPLSDLSVLIASFPGPAGGQLPSGGEGALWLIPKVGTLSWEQTFPHSLVQVLSSHHFEIFKNMSCL